MGGAIWAAFLLALLLLNVFIVVNVAVLVLKRRPVEHDHFRVPPVIPVLGIAACVLVMTQTEPDAWLCAGILLAVGLTLAVRPALAQESAAASSFGSVTGARQAKFSQT